MTALVQYLPITGTDRLEELCQELIDLGPKAVLLKGGHLQGAQSRDVLYIKAGWHTLDF